MKPPTAILLLLLGNAVASAQDCSQLPVVSNSRLQTNGQERQESYKKGDTISFICDMGYTAGRPLRYICSDKGWEALQGAICSLRECVPPEDIPNGYYRLVDGENFVFGTTVQYFCNEGYQMASREVNRTCLTGGWSNHLPICETSSCDPPPPIPGVRVEGLPVDDELIRPDRFLTFHCITPGADLNGSKTLVCGKDGQWDNPLPNCVEKTCELPAPNPKMRLLGGERGRVAAGNKVTVQCVRGSGSKELECLFSGDWDSTFPTCSDTCDVGSVPNSVQVSPQNLRQLPKGQQLQFHCKTQSHVLKGAARVTCLGDGLWSDLFPTCSVPSTCEPPPYLANGDFVPSAERFEHNTRVTYMCKEKYVIRGVPYKTCINGAWTESVITCLKPCTINPLLMKPRKITFRHGSKTKLYAPHEDHITFQCEAGAVHDGQLEMRQQCINGFMPLPRCV